MLTDETTMQFWGPAHEWDDDATCVRCGFDGAEWHWWRYSTHEGKAMQTPMPWCKEDE